MAHAPTSENARNALLMIRRFEIDVIIDMSESLRNVIRAVKSVVVATPAVRCFRRGSEPAVEPFMRCTHRREVDLSAGVVSVDLSRHRDGAQIPIRRADLRLSILCATRHDLAPAPQQRFTWKLRCSDTSARRR